MTRASNKPFSTGQLALHEQLELKVPLATTQSHIHSGARRTIIEDGQIHEFYPLRYAPENTPVGHLKFALKYEALDLRVMVAALKQIDKPDLETWLHHEPTSSFARRAWFFYEHFTGHTLDVNNLKQGNYVNALDEQKHFVTKGVKSIRQRITDNLLGTPQLCVTVRKTSSLQTFLKQNLHHQASQLLQKADMTRLARAISFLYTKETRSSFALEGEVPSPNRAARFIEALKKASAFDTQTNDDLIQLQNLIVERRYAERNWREGQNFIGETLGNYRERVHFICPKPENVSELMLGWQKLTKRLVESSLDAVIAAAISSFAFVFIHPFEDGNGRIHRFLIHHILAKKDFSPREVIFPVSAAILRDRLRYDQALEAFSKPLFTFIDWSFNEQQELLVKNETVQLYNCFDATLQAEYLYERVAETIRVDLQEELGYLEMFDKALQATKVIVDMPDKRAMLFVQLCLQNQGKLAKAKRKQFTELNDNEILRLEQSIQKLLAD
jgi:Fic family protein